MAAVFIYQPVRDARVDGESLINKWLNNNKKKKCLGGE